jgi:glyoxylase-like metal-dependent hydrolase (beta-lactamase superfamily II)
MRLIVRILIAGLALAVLALAVLVIPAHIQTRRIAPPLPGLADFRALAAEPGGPVRIEYLVNASQTSPRGTLGHTVFLIRWADGRVFMIDAGMDRAAAAEFAELLKWMWGADEGRFHGDVAAQLGDDVQSVQGVGFTHLHIDHTQGVRAFCAARGTGASIHQTRWQAEEHNFNTTEGAQIVAGSCLEARGLEGGPLIPVDGFPGLAVVALGGHTPGSTLFAAAVAGHLWLFSGDTTNTKAAIEGDVDKPFLYSWVLVPENTARTAELRHWLAALDREADVSVIVSHDLDDIAASDLTEYPTERP